MNRGKEGEGTGITQNCPAPGQKTQHSNIKKWNSSMLHRKLITYNAVLISDIYTICRCAFRCVFYNSSSCSASPNEHGLIQEESARTTNFHENRCYTYVLRNPGDRQTKPETDKQTNK